MPLSAFMQIKETNRTEVENKAKGMSDFLKMEYLEKCIKDIKNELDVKKFCHSELSKIYEARNMFLESARHQKSLSDLSITFKEKIQSYVKEIGLWIKANQLDNADKSLREVLSIANSIEKQEIKKAIKDFYQKQAEAYERSMRNAHALKLYEKLFEISNEAEKAILKEKLLFLYDKMGKIREYMKMRGGE